MEASLDVDLLALVEVLAADLREPLPGDDVMPLRLLFLGPGAVLPDRRRRDREPRERSSLRGRPQLRVLSEVSDQDDLVDAAHVICLLSSVRGNSETLHRTDEVRPKEICDW